MNKDKKLSELQQGIKGHLHEAANMASEYDDLGGKVTLNTMIHFEDDEEITNHLIGYEEEILNVLLSNDRLNIMMLKSFKKLLEEGEL